MFSGNSGGVVIGLVKRIDPEQIETPVSIEPQQVSVAPSVQPIAPTENTRQIQQEREELAKYKAKDVFNDANKQIDIIWNATIQKIMDSILPEQDEWLKKRENDCGLKASSEEPNNSVLQETIKFSCMAAMTDQRTEVLKQEIASLQRFDNNAQTLKVEQPTTNNDNSLSIRGGKLIITGEAGSGEQKLLFNDKKLRDGDGFSLSFEKNFVVGDTDVVLVMNNSGGTACPVQYFFISVTAQGEAKLSPEFGSCSDLAKPIQEGSKITITMPKMTGQGNATYVYSNGVLTEIQDTPVLQIPDNSKIQKEAAPVNAEQHIQKMLQGAMTNDGIGIQDSRQYLENLPKPTKGDRKAAREINEEALKLIQSQQYDQAVPLLAKASQTDPSDVEILNNYGFALMMSNNQEQAEAVLIKTLIMKPDRSSAWSNLGFSFAFQGKESMAVASYLNTYRFSKNPEKTLQFFKDKLAQENNPTIKNALTRAVDKIITGKN